jgi:hypothetical protein
VIGVEAGGRGCCVRRTSSNSPFCPVDSGFPMPHGPRYSNATHEYELEHRGISCPRISAVGTASLQAEAVARRYISFVNAFIYF